MYAEFCQGCDQAITDDNDYVGDPSTHYFQGWHRRCAERAGVETD